MKQAGIFSPDNGADNELFIGREIGSHAAAVEKRRRRGAVEGNSPVFRRTLVFVQAAKNNGLIPRLPDGEADKIYCPRQLMEVFPVGVDDIELHLSLIDLGVKKSRCIVGPGQGFQAIAGDQLQPMITIDIRNPNLILSAFAGGDVSEVTAVIGKFRLCGVVADDVGKLLRGNAIENQSSSISAVDEINALAIRICHRGMIRGPVRR